MGPPGSGSHRVSIVDGKVLTPREKKKRKKQKRDVIGEGREARGFSFCVCGVTFARGFGCVMW